MAPSELASAQILSSDVPSADSLKANGMRSCGGDKVYGILFWGEPVGAGECRYQVAWRGLEGGEKELIGPNERRAP